VNSTPQTNPRLFIATKAFISHNGQILLLRESQKYEDGTNAAKFDVAGGRLTPGENFKESLLREIKEETGLNVQIDKPFFVNEWRPVVKGEPWQIVGIFFKCFSVSSKVSLSSDHDEYKWIKPEDYLKVPIISNLEDAFEAYLSD
jgi:8-oxo-dGTP diphosphatase